jgi:multidrug efflux pump subunit AcrA (membrane-fusion protein)
MDGRRARRWPSTNAEINPNSMQQFRSQPPPLEPAAKLTALSSSIKQIDAEYEQKRAALEAEVARAKDLQRQLAGFERRVADAGLKLSRADSQLDLCKEAAAAIRENLLVGWGTGHQDGTCDRPPSYADLVALDLAIREFPTVRTFLELQLATAQSELNTFTKTRL